MHIILEATVIGVGPHCELPLHTIALGKIEYKQTYPLEIKDYTCSAAGQAEFAFYDWSNQTLAQTKDRASHRYGGKVPNRFPSLLKRRSHFILL